MIGDPAGPAWLVWLETTGLAEAMRQWLWLYPIVEILHIAGFVLLVGSVVMFDLRLLGVSREIGVRALARYLLPWSVAGLVIVIPTGTTMFITHATDLASNPAFLLKLTLIAASGGNAFFFHRGPYRSAAVWEYQHDAPRSAKASAILSMVLWASVISCGRLLAYL